MNHSLLPKEAQFLKNIDWAYLKTIPDDFSRLRNLPHADGYSHGKTIFNQIPGQGFSLGTTVFNKQGELIYQANYFFDSHKRRLTPGVPQETKRSIFWVGCSVTFGEGLRGDQTITAHMQRYLSETAVWNLGKQGSSINVHLKALRDSPASIEHGVYEGLPNQKSIFVYNFINQHIQRAQCPLSCYKDRNSWMMQAPDFSVLNDGEIKYRGLFSETRWFKPIVGFFMDSVAEETIQLDWPGTHDESGIPKFVALLTAYREELRQKVPLEDFYFVLYPYPYSDDRDSDILADVVTRAGFHLIDLRGLNLAKITNNTHYIPFDIHPTSRANFVVSQLVLAHIKEDHPDFQ